MQHISLIISTLGLAVLIAASLIKGETIKKTLILVFLGNVLVATSYLFTHDGVNGAVSSYLGSIQAIVNFWFTSRNKPIPIWLIILYALSFILVNLAVLESPVGIIALMATLCFVGCVSSKTGAGYRIWQTANNLLWILYDVLSHSYGPLVTHTLLCLFTVAGILINDRKRKKA